MTGAPGKLGARLLVHDPATQVVRNLFIVHDELRANGWAGWDGNLDDGDACLGAA